MKAFLLLVLVATSLCKIKNDDIDDMINELYPIIIGATKGLAEKEEAKCSAVFKNNQNDIKKIVKDCVMDIKAGTDIATAVANAALKLMLIDGLLTECNALQIPSIISKFTTKEGVLSVLKNLYKNIDTVWENIEGIWDNLFDDKYEELGVNVGKILAIATDFHVNQL